MSARTGSVFNRIKLIRLIFMIALGIGIGISVGVGVYQGIHWQKISNSQLPNTFFQTKINKTTEKQVKATKDLSSTKPLGNNQTIYTFAAGGLNKRQVITQNGVVVYEGATTFDTDYKAYPNLHDYIDQFGDPEVVFQGSKYYGLIVNCYAYPSKGFAFLAKPSSGEVFQVQSFSPTSVDGYISNYGFDLVSKTPVDKNAWYDAAPVKEGF